MSSSDYAPSQNDSSDQEMPDLITDQDFLDPEPNETMEAVSSVLSSSATESTSKEILDSFSCKTSEAMVTVSLAKVSLSPTNKDPVASSSEVDSPSLSVLALLLDTILSVGTKESIPNAQQVFLLGSL